MMSSLDIEQKKIKFFKMKNLNKIIAVIIFVIIAQLVEPTVEKKLFAGADTLGTSLASGVIVALLIFLFVWFSVFRKSE